MTSEEPRMTSEERKAAMTHSNDSQRPRRARGQCTAAALVLLASVGWARQVSAASVTALAIGPDTPATLYAGTSCSGVRKSLDGGDSWSAAVNTGLTNRNVSALAINPTSPTTLYAGTDYDGVFQSLNEGSSWSAVNTGLTDTRVRALAINPATPTTLYAGTAVAVFRSLDGGGSWSDASTGHAVRVCECTAASCFDGSRCVRV
jgi:hypothetical protein